MNVIRVFLITTILLASTLQVAFAAEPTPNFSGADLEFFEKEIRPLLAKRCYSCHSAKAKEIKGSLRLDSRAAILAGGDTGPAVDFDEQPAKTLFIDAINYGDVYQMPPKSKLPATEIAKLTEWVKRGLPWPDEDAPDSSSHGEEFDLAKRKSEHWSWQPIQHPQPPKIANDDWSADPIDQFVLRKILAANLKPADTADRRTLIRRAYFDLIGLPPSPEEVRAFIDDDSPTAYSKLLDRLLDSDHFGERWGRHWLDLVRYAESRGHEFDYTIPNAHAYRDYVIRALNDDVPYDQFLTEHVAGDLVQNPRTRAGSGANESVLGTGFWFLGEWVHSPVDIRKDETDRFDNMVDVFSKTFLGVTVACARCHDHKFDAISQADYYAMFGFLQSSAYRQVRYETRRHNVEVARKLAKLDNEYAPRLAEQLSAALEQEIVKTKAYLLASRRAIIAGPEFGDRADDVVFADFESGTYGDWNVSGDAFGGGPQTQQTIADYQGKVNATGKYFVNSHNARVGGAAKHSDRLTGTLTSPHFKVTHTAIQFLVGGGSHAGQTCVNLIVDGKAVRTATGRNSNQMSPHRWDVSDLVGKQASIQVVDKVRGGWGNIGLDHIVFTNSTNEATPPLSATQFSDDYRRQLTTIAKQYDVDARRLGHWVAHLLSAKTNERDPLHMWALVCSASKTNDDRKIGASANKAAKKLRPSAKDDAQFPEGTVVIADFTQPDPASFMTDGVTFGLRPRRRGELLLGDNKSQPIRRVAGYGSAQRDPAFRKLKIAGGTDKDAGKLSKWDRAGKTLRTRSFEIQHGKIAYLVRGKGLAYAVIDSHRMINGPLHNTLLKEFNVDADTPQWIVQDLTRYTGHGMHLEFIAVGEDDLEVLQVVDAPAGRLPLLVDRSNCAVIEAVQTADNVDQFATAIQKHFADAATSLTKDVDPKSTHTINWLIQHSTLFKFHVDQNFGQTARDYHGKRSAITAQIQRESRTAMAMWEGDAVDEYLLIRGNNKTVGSPVPRGILTGLEVESRDYGDGSGRLLLAQQMTDPANPLTSRVVVNRLWHHLTGRGIVASVDNFGVLGQEPSHPELLDYLATEFMRDGWSVKRMIKRLMLTSTYRMDSMPNPAARERDPDNILLHRMRIRRMQGEIIRDSILKLSGRLDPTLYGPPIPVHLTPFMQGRGRPGSGPIDGKGRRSIYSSIRRNFLSPMMQTFDTPQPFSTVGRRTVSNVPGQALIMMNNPLVIEQSRLWAKRLLREKTSTNDRIAVLYESAFARLPTAAESDAALAFIKKQGDELGLDSTAAERDERVWSDLCHVLMNVKEFVYVK